MKAYILIEKGGANDATWEVNIAVSLDKDILEDEAKNHNQEQLRKRLTRRTYQEVEEIPFI
jgi:hypothetical protein